MTYAQLNGTFTQWCTQGHHCALVLDEQQSWTFFQASGAANDRKYTSADQTTLFKMADDTSHIPTAIIQLVAASARLGSGNVWASGYRAGD